MPTLGFKLYSSIPVFALAHLLVLSKHLLIFPTKVFALFQLPKPDRLVHSVALVLLKGLMEF